MRNNVWKEEVFNKQLVNHGNGTGILILVPDFFQWNVDFRLLIDLIIWIQLLFNLIS